MDAEHDVSRVSVFLDGDPEPFGVFRPPARFELDTASMQDGPHELTVLATDGSGRTGVRKVSFSVRNGPGIALDGLSDGDVVDGTVSLLVNAYGGAYEEQWEPARAETPAPIPTWAWVVFLATISWASFYGLSAWSPPVGSTNVTDVTAAGSSAPTTSDNGMASDDGDASGAALYANNCASCHQANGLGIAGVFPPLANSAVVTAADPAEHIRVILFGADGRPIDGTDYPGAMPPWGDQFTDEEIADLVNHERRSWGNTAPPVTEADVAAIRADGPSGGGGEGA